MQCTLKIGCLLLALASCTPSKGVSGTTARAAEPTSKAVAEDPGNAGGGTTAATDMHKHFADINAIQQSLISGNLVATRRLARQIRAGFQGPHPAGWGPFIERSTAAAEMLEVTDDLNMAARIAGTMARTCGDCHTAHAVEVIDHTALVPPKAEAPLDEFMTLHRWAAYRMWEGLIGPSDRAWNAGAQVLMQTRLDSEVLAQYLSLTPDVQSLLLQLQKDGEAASQARTTKSREKLYGSFLAGCAGCHQDMMNQRD